MKRCVRRFLSLFLVFAAVLALSAPAMAAAPDVAEPNACGHSSLRTETRPSYEKVDGSSHKEYRVYEHYCAACGIFIDKSKVLVGIEGHSFVTTYVSSTHLGFYTSHYYTYRKTCKFCGYSYTWNDPAACRASFCIDPQ